MGGLKVIGAIPIEDGTTNGATGEENTEQVYRYPTTILATLSTTSASGAVYLTPLAFLVNSSGDPTRPPRR